MFIKQISVFLENRTGALVEITKTLKENSVNLKALCLADTADFGVLRIIVDNSAEVLKILKDNGFAAKENRVLAVNVADDPGAFHRILEVLEEKGLSVSYSYAYVAPDKGAIAILKCRPTEVAAELLIQNGFELLG